MSDSLIIYVIRHGRTALNVQKVFRGHLDGPLDAVGFEQAELTGKFLQDVDLGAIYTSPLERAVQTAEAIKKYQNDGVAVVSEPGFMDLSYGEWEGKTYPQVQEQYPELYRLWETDPRAVKVPGAETLQAAKKRTWSALQRLISESTGPALAIVSHRVVNKLLLTGMLGLTESEFWKLQQDTCCVNVIEYKRQTDEFAVLKMNESLHVFTLAESIDVVDF